MHMFTESLDVYKTMRQPKVQYFNCNTYTEFL